MPKSDAQVCVSCGGQLDVPVQGGKIKCPFCGTVNLVDARETRQGDDIICPECGAANPKDARHCGRCGIKLEITCPKCSALNAYGTVYCVKCGVDIQNEIERQQEQSKAQQAEDLRIHEQVLQQDANEKRKKRISVLVGTGVTLGILLCLVVASGAWFYTTNLSPAARSTKTAISFAQTATQISRILFQDDFSDPQSGWSEYSSANGSASYVSGGYHIQVIAKNWLVWDTTGDTYPNDVRLEVDAVKTIGQDDSSEFGVACRYQDKDNYYYLGLSSDGYAAISIQQDGKFTIISSSDKKWTSVDGIHGGSESNHLRADCVGSTLTLYANGNQVAQAIDDTFTGGSVALVAGTFDTGGTDILFNNFIVYRP